MKETHLNLERMLDRVRRHLSALGIELQEQRNAPASQFDLSVAESEIGAALPSDVRTLYLEFANGFLVQWALDDDFDDADEWGCFELPSLAKLVEFRQPYRNFWMASCDRSTLRAVPDQKALEKTIADMQHWLPFWEEACGDQFCVDLRDGKIVFNEHDWFDGGDGTNGHVVAATFFEFVTKWSSVCFTCPLGSYWPDAFTENGIGWSSEHFNERYIVS